MALPIAVPAKPYTALLDTRGVPLDNLRALIGAPLEIQRGSNGASNPQALFATAQLLRPGAISASDHDILVVRVEGGADSFEWRLDAQDWLDIPGAANPGDILSTAGASITGREVAENGGGNTIILGRNTAGQALLQLGTYAPASVPANTAVIFRLAVVTHNSGVLKRRIDPLRNHVTRQVVLHRHAAVRPDPPAVGEVEFDGINTILARNSEWQDININIAGTDPLWIASREYQYVAVVDRWVSRMAWSIHPADSTFRIQYSSTGAEPWLAADPGTPELWVRYRLDDGTWATHQTRVAGLTRQWRLIEVLYLPAGQVALSQNIPQMDLDQFELISFQYQEDADADRLGDQGNVIPHLLAAPDILSASSTDGAIQANSLVYSFPRLGPPWMVRGNYAFPNASAYEDWYQAASAAEQRGHINFGGGDVGDPMFDHLRWFRGFSTNSATLRIRGI